jgi:regulator of protease activity HflC (stomatin/prohibitin superfamily)
MAFKRATDSHCCYRFCGCTLDRKSFGCWSFWILLVIGVILMIVLLAVSIKDIDHDEFGIAYNQVTRTLGDEVLSEGRHTLTPGDKIFTFDNKIVTRTEDIECISKDGLIITFSVATQYRIIRDDARDILFEFKDQDGLFNFVDYPIRDTVKDSCATFSGEDFFSQRGVVEQDMAANTSFVLTHTNTRVTPSFVQLKNIHLPAEFSTAIQQVQLALEDVDVAHNERAQKIIVAQTDFLKAEQDALIVLDLANARASGFIAQANEQASARSAIWTERKNAVVFGATSLNMTAADYVNNVLLLEVLSAATTPTTQACLQDCVGNECWWCWTTATPAVTV